MPDLPSITATAQPLDVDGLVKQRVQEELEKAKMLEQKEAFRFRMPYVYNQQTNPDRKPGSDIPFSYLRRMAVLYPIARACINRRITQVTQLEWDITTVNEDEDEKGYEKDIAIVKAFFKQPLGHKSRMRELLTKIVDDVLTVDAISYEIRRTRGGDFLNLIAVDPTTIVLRVTQTGGTPEPPQTAYEQVILGKVVAKFTTDDLIYDSMKSRTNNPYGLAPLESLILQTEAALRGTMYNLDYFRENNVPEGFVTLPEDLATTKSEVEQWQEWFDMLVAGDRQMTHRLKILPGGSEYMPAKKPEDMAFERFEMWLLQQTCAVFDVPPQDIGITYQVNKATGEVQSDISDQRGLFPLYNFIKEVLDDIIQKDMGFEHLQIIARNINPKDRKEEVEIAEKEIKMGALSVDEYRIESGREPIGLDHYVAMGNQVVRVSDLLAGKLTIQPPAPQDTKDKNKDSDENEPDDEAEKLMINELRKWRRCIINDLKVGKPLRTKFPSEHIPEDVRASIVKGLEHVDNKEKANLVFNQYLDPHVRASMTLLKYAANLKELEHELNS
jgi:hypothetical protein